MTDATCYESHMRFPTDMKLLWESLEWLYRHICRHCRELGMSVPRNKYRNVANLSSLQEKKEESFKGQKMLKRCMIKLLERKTPQSAIRIHSEYGASPIYPDYRVSVFPSSKVLVQEKEMFEGRKSAAASSA